MNFHEFDGLPERLLSASPAELTSILPGPSLIRITGRLERPLFVSVFLHGNETSGFLAMQEYLTMELQQDSLLPRTLYWFIGNVEAASLGLRRLADQPDYNRIWSSGELPEHAMAQALLSRLRNLQPFAAIDIHNNTGRNPFYACVNRLEPAFLRMAGLFSSFAVYFTEPHEVISMACAQICPSVTVECGLAGETSGIGQLVHFVRSVMALESLNHAGEAVGIAQVYHTIAKMTVPKGSQIGFDARLANLDCQFPADLDKHNFQNIPANMVLAPQKKNGFRLLVTDNDGQECGDRYFLQNGDDIRTTRPMVLAMLTTDTRIIHMDCFGYIMEPYPLP